MDRGSQLIDRSATNRSAPSSRSDLRPARPQLALVSPQLRLGLPQEAAPVDWYEGLARLVAWLGITVEFVPSAPEGRLARMAEWVRPGAAIVEFAPWLGWAPSAFQHGGLPILPQAHWVASYLHEQGRGVMAAPGAVDLALLSPHPAGCSADEAGMPPLPAGDDRVAARRGPSETGDHCSRTPAQRDDASAARAAIRPCRRRAGDQRACH